ncbi:hypothetical protein OC861_003423 [Tilletia horrida]|nr:hypothetical protein OC861_003423 [Tilletia horrida]
MRNQPAGAQSADDTHATENLYSTPAAWSRQPTFQQASQIRDRAPPTLTGAEVSAGGYHRVGDGSNTSTQFTNMAPFVNQTLRRGMFDSAAGARTTGGTWQSSAPGSDSTWAFQNTGATHGQLVGAVPSNMVPHGSAQFGNGQTDPHYGQQQGYSGTSDDGRPIHLQTQTGMPAVSLHSQPVMPYSGSGRSTEADYASRMGNLSNNQEASQAETSSRIQGGAGSKRASNHFSQAQEQTPHIRRRRRPPFSYAGLIAQAINSSPEGRLTLREIYQWISTQFPALYPMAGPESQGWQNTVRHNLSLNKAFKKQARTARDPPADNGTSGTGKGKGKGAGSGRRGKGGFWTLDPVRGAALLNSSASRGDGGDDEDRDRVKDESSSTHDRAREASSASSSMAASGAGHPTGTSSSHTSTTAGTPSFPSVLLPRLRTDSPSGAGNSANAFDRHQLNAPPGPGHGHIFPLGVPPTPQTAPLQPAVYPSLSFDASGRPRGYTIGTTDQVREQAWLSAGGPSQNAVAGIAYGFAYPLDGTGSERYGARARHQTTTGVTSMPTSTFGGSPQGIPATQAYPPNFPQQRNHPQWGGGGASSSNGSIGPGLAMGGFGNGANGGNGTGGTAPMLFPSGTNSASSALQNSLSSSSSSAGVRGLIAAGEGATARLPQDGQTGRQGYGLGVPHPSASGTFHVPPGSAAIGPSAHNSSLATVPGVADVPAVKRIGLNLPAPSQQLGSPPSGGGASPPKMGIQRAGSTSAGAASHVLKPRRQHSFINEVLDCLETACGPIFDALETESNGGVSFPDTRMNRLGVTAAISRALLPYRHDPTLPHYALGQEIASSSASPAPDAAPSPGMLRRSSFATDTDGEAEIGSGSDEEGDDEEGLVGGASKLLGTGRSKGRIESIVELLLP